MNTCGISPGNNNINVNIRLIWKDLENLSNLIQSLIYSKCDMKQRNISYENISENTTIFDFMKTIQNDLNISELQFDIEQLLLNFERFFGILSKIQERYSLLSNVFKTLFLDNKFDQTDLSQYCYNYHNGPTTQNKPNQSDNCDCVKNSEINENDKDEENTNSLNDIFSGLSEEELENLIYGQNTQTNDIGLDNNENASE